jgi:hypothetical protein
MDPFTIAALGSTAINVVGKLFGGSSASAADEAQAASYDRRAGIDDFNAMLYGTQADVAHLGVDFAASKERTELGKVFEAGRQTLAAQRSYFAGGNLDPTFGSPLLVQAVTAGRVSTDAEIAKASFAISKADALTTEANLRGQSYSATLQAGSDRASASALRDKGDADMISGFLGAGTSLLSGVGSMSGGGFSGGGGALGTMQVGSQLFPAYG